MGMILRIASSRIVGQGDIVGRSGYFSLNLSANSVMRGRLDARRTLKSLVADLRYNACNPILERDYFEIQLYSISKSLGKSILGICRGMQIINISEGGTLCQNIDTYLEHSIRKDGWIPYHSIKIKKNTILHQLLDIEEYTVSSTHHQCIKKLGTNIVASAYSADGIVEAIELCSDKQKIIGFQGHIENMLTNYTEYNKIIKYILS